MKRIFVIGSINTDLVIHAPYMPQSGETLTGNGFFVARGGKGANQAVAAARLGGNVVMCACVGNDAFGREAIASLEREGIDVSHVRIAEGVPTGTAVIVVVNGDNRIILDRGANEALTRGDIDGVLSTARQGDILLVQAENPIPVIGYALHAAKRLGMVTILNPAPADKALIALLPDCDLVIPNESETEILGGKESVLEKTEGELLITLGGKGYALCTDGQERLCPCMKVKPVDTTAAGDTFCGGLAARLAEGASLEVAAEFGCKAASIACTRSGAQPSIPTKEEVLN